MSMRIYEIADPVWSQRVLGDDTLVWIDTEKLRASWENDRYGYFDGNDHPNAIKNRIDRFGEWIKQGIPIQAPEVSLSDDGHVIFTNGRHRFVWMLQHGIQSLPVAVTPVYVDEITKRFGR